MRLSKLFTPRITELGYQFHGWLGFKFSILLFIFSFTGTFLVLYEPVVWCLYKEMRITPAGEFNYDRIYQNILKKHPYGAITRIRTPSSSKMVSRVTLEVPLGDRIEKAILYCNPYTGDIVSGPHYNWGIRKFISEIHMHLSLKESGYYLVCFVGVVLMGIVLFSIPLIPDVLPSMFWIRVTKGKKIFYSDLHKFMGIWSFVFLFIIGFTCTFFFIRSVTQGAKTTPIFAPFTVFSSNSDVPSLFKLKLSESPPQLKISTNLNHLIKKIIKEIPAFSLISIYFGTTKREPWVFWGREGMFSNNLRISVYVDPFSGEIMEIFNRGNLSLGSKFSQLMEVLHFGYFWGMTSKILWGLFGLLLSLLSFTGLLIRWRTLSRKKDKNLGYFKYASFSLLFCVLWYTWTGYVQQNLKNIEIVEKYDFVYQGMICEIQKTIYRSKNRKQMVTLNVFFQNGNFFKNVTTPIKAYFSETSLEKTLETGAFVVFCIPNVNEQLSSLQKKIKIQI